MLFVMSFRRSFTLAADVASLPSITLGEIADAFAARFGFVTAQSGSVGGRVQPFSHAACFNGAANDSLNAARR
jgi:hypothetical protein